MDIQNVGDALKVLDEYKDSPGHKAMVEIAFQNMSQKLQAFMYSEGDDVDLKQLRADFRAWMDVVTVVDKRMDNYKASIQQVIQETERQQQHQQQMMNRHGGAR